MTPKHFPVVAWWPGKRVGPPVILGFDATLTNDKLTIAYCTQTRDMRRGPKRLTLASEDGETITALVEWETTRAAAYKLELRLVSN